MQLVRVCFVCKLCRGTFLQVTDLISHKLRSHFNEFHNVKYIIFEETNATEDQCLKYFIDDKVPSFARTDTASPFPSSSNAKEEIQFEQTQLTLSFDLTYSDQENSVDFDIVNESLTITSRDSTPNIFEDSNSPSPTSSTITDTTASLKDNHNNKIEINEFSQIQVGTSKEISSQDVEILEINHIDGHSDSPNHIVNTTSNLKTNKNVLQNPFVRLERLKLPDGIQKSAKATKDQDQQLQRKNEKIKQEDENSDSDYGSQGDAFVHRNGDDSDSSDSNCCRSDSKQPPSKKSRLRRGNYNIPRPFCFPTELSDSENDNDSSDPMTQKLTLVEWLRKKKEEHPDNKILLQPDPIKENKAKRRENASENTAGISILPISETNPISCKLCCTDLTSETELKIHVTHCWLNNKQRHRYCVPCGRKFRSSASLRGHTQRVHPTCSRYSERYKCQTCFTIFMTTASFQHHLKDEHDQNGDEIASALKHSKMERQRKFLYPLFTFPVEEEDSDSDSDPDPGPSSDPVTSSSNCRGLGEWLRKRSKLTGQGQGRTQVKNIILLDPDPIAIPPEESGPISMANPITCRLCCKILLSESEVKIHARHCWLRNKQRHRYCVPCGKKMSKPGDLRLHNVAIHMTEEEKQATLKYICEFCSMRFNFESKLKLHLETHKKREEQNRRFVCHICGVAYLLKVSLDAHMASHSDARDFACNYPGCTSRFKMKCALTTHQKVHSQERPFQCEEPGCRLTFRFKSNLNSHGWVHRGGQPKMHKCTVDSCNAKFMKPSYLKRHMETIHAASTPHPHH